MNRDENGLTPLQAAFVREYLLSLNATDAYKKAGYKSKSEEACGANAARLIGTDRVKKAIAKAQSEDKEKPLITRREILKRLERESRPEVPDGTQSGRIRALELLAKHKGLFKDRTLIPGIPDTEQQEEGEVDVFVYIKSIAARIRRERLPGGEVSGNGHTQQVDHPPANGEAKDGTVA